jgi:hypothetical protein
MGPDTTGVPMEDATEEVLHSSQILQSKKKHWFLDIFSRLSDYSQKHKLFSRNLFTVRLDNVEFTIDAAMIYKLSQYFMEDIQETIREILLSPTLRKSLAEEIVQPPEITLELEHRIEAINIQENRVDAAVQVRELQLPSLTHMINTELADILNRMVALIRMSEDDALVCEHLRRSKPSPVILWKPNGKSRQINSKPFRDSLLHL